MTTINQNGWITRRVFFERSAGVLAAAGTLAGVAAANGTPDSDKNHMEVAKADATAMTGKIALEEHFALPDASDAYYEVQPTSDFRVQILDMGDVRVAEMDRGGVELCILSHAAPGLQAMLDPAEAVATARRWNDYLAGHIAKYPKRLKVSRLCRCRTLRLQLKN